MLRVGRQNRWEIMQRIQVLSGEVLSVTPGALYPAQHRLEERGLISADWSFREQPESQVLRVDGNRAEAT